MVIEILGPVEALSLLLQINIQEMVGREGESEGEGEREREWEREFEWVGLALFFKKKNV